MEAPLNFGIKRKISSWRTILQMENKTEVIVLAAGKGKRMHSATPKVLQEVGGRPLLQHVLDTVRSINPNKIHVVYGFGGQQVREAISDQELNWVKQESQLGTGDAAARAIPFVEQTSNVIVVYGDVPLIRSETLFRLVGMTRSERLVLLTAMATDASGYGRIIRDENGRLERIIEDLDASEEEKMIREINVGLIAAPARLLNHWLDRLESSNVQGERYLTDVVEFATASSPPAVTCPITDLDEAAGINSRSELAKAERIFQRRQAIDLMANGLTLYDPARFDLRGTLSVGEGSVIDINVVIEGEVRLGDRVTVGPNCIIRDSVIGDDVVIEANCVIDGAKIEEGCNIGPFARVRPDTELAPRSKLGNFVEIKKTRLGSGTKVNHLAYLGDTTVGKEVNVGAGVITCNYDGVNKHRTIIEDGAFIGSDSQLVAPVTVGKDATIGAGSTIRNDAPPGKLTITRAKAKTLQNWRRPKKKNE